MHRLFHAAPTHLQVLANTTGLPLQEVTAYFHQHYDCYERIFHLQEYLINSNNGKTPALSKEQILATSENEMHNLKIAYPLIKAGHMTIDQARILSENERYVLIETRNLRPEDQFNRLLSFRAAPGFGKYG